MVPRSRKSMRGVNGCYELRRDSETDGDRGRSMFSLGLIATFRETGAVPFRATDLLLRQL